MKPTTYLTTSWDDGHPLDLRVAELLMRHGIRGTFYIPKTGERETMAISQIQQLSSAFELGAHTLHHVVLTGATDEVAWQEISASKLWVEDTIGSPCLLFCPPRGQYAGRHLEMIRRASFSGLRTTELGSLDFPRRRGGLLVMPTTLQAHPHRLSVLARNAIKRRSLGNLWRLMVYGRSRSWPELAQSLLLRAVERGGVFHLWGHSWELQETGQWQRLDEVLRFMSWFVRQATPLTNGQVCQLVSSQGTSLDGSDV